MKQATSKLSAIISCPKCEEQISIGDALFQEIEESVKSKYAKEVRSNEAALKKEADEIARAKIEVEQLKKDVDRVVAEKIQGERAKILKEAVKDAEKKKDEEISGLKDELAAESKKVTEARNTERELRKLARDLEDKAQNLDLEVARKLDAERDAIRTAAITQASEENRLKVADKDKQLDDLKKKIDELQRKSEQGSQQLQGEVFELELERALVLQFPIDNIEPVAKGVKGGDVIHKVIGNSGSVMGSMLWEMKRTKAWSDTWLTKIREDQRLATADHAIIVSQVLPKGVVGMAQIDGVWVCDFKTAMALAIALRHHVFDVGLVRASAAGRGEKLEGLFHYLTGTRFRQRIEAIVEAFTTMQEDLQREKRAVQKIWATREQQLSAVLLNTSGMYGDVHGVLGASMPKIPSLEFQPEPIEV